MRKKKRINVSNCGFSNLRHVAVMMYSWNKIPGL